jgi:hypothetical protein
MAGHSPSWDRVVRGSRHLHCRRHNRPRRRSRQVERSQDAGRTARAGLLVGHQPRYLLPIIILLAGVSLLRRYDDPVRVSRGQALVVAGALVVANSVALYTNIRRYVTGLDATWGNLDKGVEWWWNIPVSPMGMWAIGSVAFAAVLFWLARLWDEHARPIDRSTGSVTSRLRLADADPIAR